MTTDFQAPPTGPDAKVSTTETGAPAPSDQFSLSVGPDGPLLLHDFHFVNQMAHFDRERVPERVVHAKGGGAFGFFETTADVSQWTKAAMFQPGVRTEMLARFSTVAGELGSADTVRDPRGFALKFYTSEGNWDLVGNNTPIFFVRDAMKFPHFIRTQKRLPDSGLQDWDMRWDFWTLSPESAHQVTYLMGDRGIPKTWRHMNGYGSHTYMWVNAGGERSWVKFHFHADAGVENLSNDDAALAAAADPDAHRRDLFNHLKRGGEATWTLKVQVMPYEDAKSYRINPFDLTKVWPHADYPLIEVGRMVLDRNPENHFAQIEQAAFEPSAIVPGIGFSPDKMLLGRVFSYADTHRHRIGANYHQLPVNRPHVEVNTYEFDGPMRYDFNPGQPTYFPNTVGGPEVKADLFSGHSWESDGDMVRQAYTLRPDDDDFSQAGEMVRQVFDDAARERLVATVASTLGTVQPELRSKVYDYWRSIDKATGDAVADMVEGGREPADVGPAPASDEPETVVAQA
ncbi:catalase [Friedmanniella endophytica]|uniref:Catalase n=1 Tax=Microlunatus kandeliicorticis TaxID=1759536 RepID=A0A7W3P611_9ACTN|nr:catalase [Microlunatus kandeliicorticis]MBA8794445.1 catalase [Microlunatus kandeliicorticis]